MPAKIGWIQVKAERLARTKAKGRFLLRDLALSIRLSETRFGFQIATLATVELCGTHERQPVLLPHSSRDYTRCESFPTTVRFQLPGLSLVADSLRLLLVRSLLWKITLPLKPIVLLTNTNASAASKFLLWKWSNKSGKFRVPDSSPAFGLESDNKGSFAPRFA
jgi:hypothetical protein